MNTNIIPFSDLQRLSGYDQPGWVAQWCEKHRVPVFVGRDGQLATTLDALNAALGVAKGEAVRIDVD